MRYLLYAISFWIWGGIAMAGIKTDGSAHIYNFDSIDGGTVSLSSFAGKVILIVNTASQCGFTKQYAEMQELWTKFETRGLVVIGVPSNAFGSQEPDNEKKIKNFCKTTFDIDFPMTAKVKVSGDAAHPFYRWAVTQGGSIAKPRWNFHKYLLDPEGRLVDWFSSPTSPLSSKVIKAIEEIIPIKMSD